LTVSALAVALTGGVARGDTPERGGGDPCSGDTIKVGGVVDGGFYGDAGKGAQARFARANADGELPGGRTVEFIDVEDDHAEPSEDTDAVRKLIQQDGVCAIVPLISSNPDGVEFAEQQGTPVFGWAIGPQWCDKTVAFGFTGGCLTPPEPETYSNTWGTLLKEKFKAEGDSVKGKTLAIIGDDNDLARSGIETQTASVEDVGIKVVYSEANVPGPPAPSPADFTPFANDLLSSDDGEPPDIILLLLSPLNVLGMAGKLKELGYDGVQTNAVQYDPRLIGGAEGSTVFIQFAAFQSAPENAHVQQLIDDVTAEFPDIDPETGFTQPLGAGYWSADFFIEMAKETGKKLTQSGLVETGNDNFTWGVKDTVGKSKWPRDHANGSACGSLVEASNGEYVVAVPFLCAKLKEL